MSKNNRKRRRKRYPTMVEEQPLVLDDGLTLDEMWAGAIEEQIELARQKNGSSSREDPSLLQQIDPEFQREFNNL
jgi:hypothetical protein